MMTKSFLEKFLGEYEILSMSMFVTLKADNALLVSIPGEPEYALIPYKGTEFHVKGHSGLSIEFKSDDTGVVTEAILTLPYGVFTAKKKTN